MPPPGCSRVALAVSVAGPRNHVTIACKTVAQRSKLRQRNGWGVIGAARQPHSCGCSMLPLHMKKRSVHTAQSQNWRQKGTAGTPPRPHSSVAVQHEFLNNQRSHDEDVEQRCDDCHPDPTIGALRSGKNKFSFLLDPGFVQPFADRPPPFGFNGLGEFVYHRTYARYLPNGTDVREQWFQTVERVVNGTFSMLRNWHKQAGLPWDERQASEWAEEMYRRIFHMKFLPPGRGLWAMGSPLTTERGLFAPLNNCAFVSTRDLPTDPNGPAYPFAFLMDASMLGIGVGFDTEGAGSLVVQRPGPERTSMVIGDSREQWVLATRRLLESYFRGGEQLEFDYSQLRPAGEPIRGFGGVSQGPEPLRTLHCEIRNTLDPLSGKPLTVTAIVDIMNQIGKCVVAGNVRRSAEIAFGDPSCLEYIDLKDYDKNPQRASWGWTSNNSVFARLGMDYSEICKRISRNGEPGLAWLQNMQEYGRMSQPKDHADRLAKGGNPCLEQTLESYEICCLVETFPDKHETLEDFQKTLFYAFLYAKTVTLGGSHWDHTNDVMQRNRRVGCSISGLAQFVAHRGLDTLKQWCEAGYATIREVDARISRDFGVRQSIKVTSVKPSGTVSLLAGATPGLHFPESRFYIRRVRVAKNSDVVEPLRKAGYRMEPSATDPEGTVVVEIPVDVGADVRTAKDVPMWEQLELAAFLQAYWADNQVSCTVTFDPETEGPSLAHALDFYQYRLKGVSFLPRIDYGAFPQMPYEAIPESQYRELTRHLQPVDYTSVDRQPQDTVLLINEVPDKFCDAESCEILGAVDVGRKQV